jgi:hypothetical protein
MSLPVLALTSKSFCLHLLISWNSMYLPPHLAWLSFWVEFGIFLVWDKMRELWLESGKFKALFYETLDVTWVKWFGILVPCYIVKVWYYLIPARFVWRSRLYWYWERRSFMLLPSGAKPLDFPPGSEGKQTGKNKEDCLITTERSWETWLSWDFHWLFKNSIDMWSPVTMRTPPTHELT